MSIDVTLTQEEMEIAAMIGCRRMAESLANRRLSYEWHLPDDTWGTDIEGAAAEMAFCKAMNRFWSGSVNTFKDADVGENVQIRATTHSNGCLIVRDNDPDDEYFVLVVGKAPDYSVKGWILGGDAKQDEYKKAPNGDPPAYFVPQRALTEINRRQKPGSR